MLCPRLLRLYEGLTVTIVRAKVRKPVGSLCPDETNDMALLHTNKSGQGTCPFRSCPVTTQGALLYGIFRGQFHVALVVDIALFIAVIPIFQHQLLLRWGNLYHSPMPDEEAVVDLLVTCKVIPDTTVVFLIL